MTLDGRTPGEPDSEGCLLVVASYSDTAVVARSVTAQAAARIMISPELGDFFELRFADLGARPMSSSGHSGAVTSIAAELTRPPDSTCRSYFALVIADRSAAAASQLLAECGTHPVIAALPLRARGLASTDDRQPSTPPQGGDPEIVIAPAGGWDEADLVSELRRYARELPRVFAAGNEPGLTPHQISLLRSANELGPAEEVTHLESGLSLAVSPDALTPRQDESARPLEVPARPLEVPAQPREESARPPEEPAQRRDKAGQTLTRPGSRRLPALLRWHDRGAEASGAGGDGAAGQPGDEPRAAGLVYLVLIGYEGTTSREAWRRGQSVLLEVDRHLATAQRTAYRVRVLRDTGDVAMGKLQQAGRLTRRDIGRPDASLDLPRLLGVVQVALKRDLASGQQAGPPAARPAIVFFAADVPLADAVTAGRHGELAREASVTWIVPPHLADLISPGFAEEGACVVTDHPEVAGEVLGVIPGGG